MNFSNLKLKNIDFVIKFRSKQKRWSAKNRLNHIIGFQSKGRGKHDFGYQEFVIGEKYIYFLNQKDNFDVEMYEDCFSYSVHFTTYEPIEDDSFSFKINNEDEIVALLDKIEKQKNLSPDADNLASSYFYKLCSVFDELREKSCSYADKRIASAKEYIDVNFKEKTCLEDAYKLCNISRRRFNELFKNSYNITPNKYVVSRKIELAKQLLKSGSLSVSEISDTCGFSDVYYFCKVFKDRTGYTAREYKCL